jgi:SAM-dependent methyltransferase
MDKFDKSVGGFNEYAGEYAEKFKNIDPYVASLDRFCNLIKTNNPTILELGCGPGNITRYVKDKFPESRYIAVDLAPRMIEIAGQQVKGVDFRVMDARDISSFDTMFDAIVCSFCLPFLSKNDADKLIAGCAGRLKANGAIYISTMEGDESMAGYETTSFSGDTEIYFNYHSKEDLENSMLDNGFTIDQLKRQEYYESNGRSLIDMIIIGIRNQ